MGSEVDDLVLAVSPNYAMSNFSPLRGSRRLAKLSSSKRQQLEKLTTSHLAQRLGIQSGILLDRLIGRGFLTLKHGRKYLTPDGRRASGEKTRAEQKASSLSGR